MKKVLYRTADGRTKTTNAEFTECQFGIVIPVAMNSEFEVLIPWSQVIEIIATRGTYAKVQDLPNKKEW